jgi:hypothetical protein
MPIGAHRSNSRPLNCQRLTPVFRSVTTDHPWSFRSWPLGGSDGLLDHLAGALGFAGVGFVVVLVFTGASFVPALLFEEVASGTLLPVLLVARPVAVVLAKAVVGLVTMAGGACSSRCSPARPPSMPASFSAPAPSWRCSWSGSGCCSG